MTETTTPALELRVLPLGDDPIKTICTFEGCRAPLEIPRDLDGQRDVKITPSGVYISPEGQSFCGRKCYAWYCDD